MFNDIHRAEADPGFPGGGVDPLGGHGPPTWVLFSKNDAKMKELGPVGDPPMQSLQRLYSIDLT